MKRVKIVLLLAALGACAAPGCEMRAPLGQVSGTVHFRGQPVEQGSIVFEVPGSRPATGKIVAGQICEVTTFAPNDGAPLGTARIAVVATQQTPAEKRDTTTAGPSVGLPSDYMGTNRKSPIPSRYSDPASSGLSWQIKEGMNQIQLDLTD